jgi:hypothetical protein
MNVDEYVLDTATLRAFVDRVHEATGAASSPETACEAIRP